MLNDKEAAGTAKQKRALICHQMKLKKIQDILLKGKLKAEVAL